MGQKAKVSVPRLIIRREPSPDGAVVAELPQGTELEVVQRSPRYTRVRYLSDAGQVEGWASTNMLEFNHSPGGKPRICPVCQSDSWKTVHAGVQQSPFFFAPVHLGGDGVLKGDGDQVDLMAQVCLGCGYVSWFVPPSELRKL
jgi:hypothetical protein